MDTTYSPKEIETLHSTIHPSNQTLLQLAKRGAHYQRIQHLASQELSHDDAQFRRLHASVSALATSPEHPTLVLLDQPRTNPQSPHFHSNLPENPDYTAIEGVLAGFDAFFKQEPQSFNDYFWRWTYSANAFFIFHEHLIALPLKDKPSHLVVYLKCMNKLQSYVLGQASLSNAAALPVTPSRSGHPDNTETTKSHSFPRSILRRARIPLRGIISASDASSIASNFKQLQTTRFEMPDPFPDDSNVPQKVKWRVVGANFVDDRYTIQYLDLPDHPFDVAKTELMEMLTSSTKAYT